MLPVMSHKNLWLVPRLKRVRDVDTMFDRFWSDLWRDDMPAGNYFGNLDIRQDDDKLYVEADLPGFTRDQIDITLEDDVLHLEANRQAKEESKQKGYYIRERTVGQWTRTVRLPAPVQEEDIKATLENGVLSITLTKTPEHKKHRIKLD